MANGMRVMDIGFMSLRGKLGDIEFNSCPLGMLEMERGVKHNSGEVWKSNPLSSMWNNWREKKRHTFEGKHIVQLKGFVPQVPQSRHQLLPLLPP